MAGAKVPITFRIFKGDSLVRQETLSLPVIKIGKLSSSHLRLDDDSVSRMHAVIEVTGLGDVSIIDLGSTKGTYVNGQKVNKARLQSGDKVMVGNTRLEVDIGGQGAGDEEAPTRVLDTGGPGKRRAMSPRPGQMGTGRQSALSPRAPGAATPRPGASPRTPLRSPAPAGRGGAPPRSGVPGAPGARTPMSGTAGANPAVRGAGPAATAPAASAAAAAPAVMAPAAAGSNPAVATPMFGKGTVDDAGDARAIEVAAMLGDSVVGVKHLLNPKSGKITPITYALFAIGAVMLLMSVVAFRAGIHNAEFNKEQSHIWVHELNRPAFEYRPKRLSLAYDWTAFGGGLLGLVAMTWGLVRLRNEQVSPYFRIGTASGIEFPAGGLPVESFPLVSPVGGEFAVHYMPDMEGELTVDGQSVPLNQLQSQGQAIPSGNVQGAMQASVPAKGRYRITVGKNVFLITAVPKPKRQAAPLFASLESRLLAFLGGSAVVHLGFLLLLFNIPPSPRSLDLDLRNNNDRLTRFQSKAQEDPLQEEEPETDGAQNSGGTGTAMALDSGKMGKEDSDRKAGQYAMKNLGGDPQLAREQAVEQARNAGFLGAIKMSQGGAFAALTGTGDFSTGLDDANVYGGLMGNEAGEMAGGFGFGRSGFGAGGGGSGMGTIGTGRYGTIGHGSGTGTGYGTGSGRGGVKGRRAVAPEVRIGNAAVTGDLDKNIIRRYIRQKLPSIRYCYEKQLLVKQDLAGTVVSQFQISPQGVVLNSKASGINNEVSSCVASVIQTIKFPKPKGAGLVQVRYPFNFRASGG